MKQLAPVVCFFQIAAATLLFLKSKLCGGIGVRFSPALELAGGSDVYLLIDFGRPRLGSGHERLRNFGKSRERVLDVRVRQGEMKLADRLQTPKPMSETVSQIPKERVDELLKVVALVGPHRDKVVENLVIAPGVELGL